MALTSPTPARDHRIVALRAAGLGDLVAVAPALCALSRRAPDHRCAVATPPALAAVLAAIDAPLELIPHAGTAPLRLARPPDLAVNLHGCGPESHRALLAVHPARLLAHRHPAVPEHRDGPRWDPDAHEVERWCRLLEWYDIAADPEEPAFSRPAPPPAPWRGCTIVHPGAGAPARRWPAARWAALADHLTATGHAVLVTGSARERGLVGDVVDAAQGPLATAVGWPLARLLGVVSAARLVCSGDTGIAHLAFAYGVRSVTLYGPVPPSRWGPLPGRPHHVTLWAGRTGDPHRARTDAGLLAIGVADAVHATAVAEAVQCVTRGGHDRFASSGGGYRAR